MRRRPSFIGAPFVAALLSTYVTIGHADAAVMLEQFKQESARGFDGLVAINLTVGMGRDRLLVVGIAIADDQIEATSVTWNAVPLIRIGAREISMGGNGCRVEIWRLVAPAPGTNPLRVALSGISPFGLGAVAYTGVDQLSSTGPVTWVTGMNSDLLTSVAAADGRPVLGLACLGGAWTTGPGPKAAAVAVGPGDQSLWDFTEPGLVGVGSHRLAANGQATLRWDVTAIDNFTWIAGGMSITPAIELVADGGGDASPDVPPDQAAALDQASPDDGIAPVDLDGMLDAADEVPDAAQDAGPIDAPGADEAGTTIRNVALDVGCACRAGGAGASPAAVWFLVIAAVALLAKRRRS